MMHFYYVKLYANNEEQFRTDFANAFSQLIALGCPEHCQPNYVSSKPPPLSPDKEFIDLAMHGSINRMKILYETNPSLNVNYTEKGSGRTAAHKASFFGHSHVIEYLTEAVGHVIDLNIQDTDGDTPLHDASRFGHVTVVEVLLLKGGANQSIHINAGKTPYDLAIEHEKTDVATMLAV